MDSLLAERLKERMRFEHARSAPPEGFPGFPDIPAGRYTDPGFFALEQRRIWSKTWLFAGHEDELPEVGSYRLWDDSGKPMLLVRGLDRQVRAFFNTCRHRGGPVVRDVSGRAPVLRCSYHGWTYDLAGQLVAVPDERDFVGLDKSCRGLLPLRCESFGRFLFVNEDASAAPLLDWLGPVARELAEFQPERLRLVERHGFDLACNWKVAIDAFLEVYHLKHIHPHTVDRLLDQRGAVMGLFANGHSRMVTPNRTGDQGTHGFPEIETVGEIARIANLAYNVFPNLVTPTDATGFPFLLFWPRGITKTRFEVWWFAPGDSTPELETRWQQRLQIFDVVLREDTANLEWIQKSVESPAFRGVPLNYQERRIYWLHEEIDRVLGDEVPTHLRVAPRLARYLET
jgi:phenylpropionate dioxygenase-like ring-hydroxylating dioxygenase large terminal subunit